VSGRAPQIRDLLNRLNTFVTTLNSQRDNIIATIDELDRFSSTLAFQDPVITRALRKIPPALAVIVKERPRITEAPYSNWAALSEHSCPHDQEGAGRLGDEPEQSQPTRLCPRRTSAATLIPPLPMRHCSPLGQNIIDRGIRGDYINVFATIDITKSRLKKGLAAARGGSAPMRS